MDTTSHSAEASSGRRHELVLMTDRYKPAVRTAIKINSMIAGICALTTE